MSLILTDTSVTLCNDILENERYILKTAFKSNEMVLSRTELKPFQETRGHTHINEEIYIFEDACVLKLDQSFYDIKKNDVVFIPSAVFHQVINNSENIVCFNCFYPK